MRTIQYYAVAMNKKNKIEQLLITRYYAPQLVHKEQEFTGKIYKSMKEAEQDMIKLNCNPQ